MNDRKREDTMQSLYIIPSIMLFLCYSQKRKRRIEYRYALEEGMEMYRKSVTRYYFHHNHFEQSI